MANALPAITLALIVVCQGFFVAAIVACRSNALKLRSLAGMLLGVAGVLLIIASQTGFALDGDLTWILAALSIPAVYAVEDLLLSDGMPIGLDVIAGTGLSALAGALMLFPLAWLTDDLVRLSSPSEPLSKALLCLGMISAVGTVLMARLLRQAGSRLIGLCGYIITAFSIGWAVILLNETVGVAALGALFLLFTGLALMEPRRRKRRANSAPRANMYS